MKQSEIWLINLDPTVGAEIKKRRPAIIVNDNALGKLPLKIIVPITDWKDRYKRAGYFGHHCATRFGHVVPVVSGVIVPL